MNANALLHAWPASAAPNLGRRVPTSIDSGAARAVEAPVAEADTRQPAYAPFASTPPQAALLPAQLVIELDAAAERFVQTLVAAGGQTVLRRYPDENQLAFSRGINAYMAAIARG